MKNNPRTENINNPELPTREIFRTSLPTGHPQEELRLILFLAGNSRWLNLEVHCGDGSAPTDAPAHQVTLPLDLWPRFLEAVCCLGAFMKPMPAPAYQARSCCSYVCSQTPETVVLGQDSQEQIHLCLQDRRGSTFLEIKTVEPPAAGNLGEDHTLRIGPTLWSAFLSAVQRLDQIIADL